MRFPVVTARRSRSTETQHFTGFRGDWQSWRNWWVEAWWRGRYVGIY